MDIIYAEKYYSQIKERYPDLSEKQIDKIIKYGLRSFFMHNSYGADVLIKSNYYTAYVGKLFMDDSIFRKYRGIKNKIKLRIKYLRAKTKFNGKYYFNLSKEVYNSIIKPQTKGKGRKRTKFYFEELPIRKIYEECLIFNPDYIFELDYPEDVGFYRKLKKFTTRNFRLVAKKNGKGIIEPVSDSK